MKNRVMRVMAPILLCSLFASPVLAAEGETFHQALKRQIDEKAKSQAVAKKAKWEQQHSSSENWILQAASVLVPIASIAWYINLKSKPYVYSDLPDEFIPFAGLVLGGVLASVSVFEPNFESIIREELERKLSKKSYETISEEVNNELSLAKLITFRDNLDVIGKALHEEGFEFTDVQWAEFEYIQNQVKQLIRAKIA